MVHASRRWEWRNDAFVRRERLDVVGSAVEIYREVIQGYSVIEVNGIHLIVVGAVLICAS